MFEKLLLIYRMSMMNDVRSPMVHLVGPAGTGKSSVMQELADLLGVQLHVINVSRLSPLEVEGVQMPHGSGEDMVLKMLPARYWTRLQEGDIILMDEFLRGFPEVYNSLLDVFTSRKVGEFELPRVVIFGASNSVVTYDPALEDRLIHMPVPDPRKNKTEFQRIADLMVEICGLLPEMAKSQEMEQLLHENVLPSYELLDAFTKSGTKVVADKPFTSVRNLIGQVQMRYVKTRELKDLIEMNNIRAMQESKPQFVVILPGSQGPPGYHDRAAKLNGNPKLSPVQAANIQANLELLEFEAAKHEEGK